MPFTLTSRAFVDGGRIPRQFTCDGANMPPPLTWSGPPEGTRSFALILDDADSPGPAFAHWVLYDIPARVTAWPTELSCKTVRNGFGRSGYGGPCPRPNEGLRRYVFSVYALDIRFLPVTREGVDGLRAALEAHTLATSHLVGYYEREADRYWQDHRAAEAGRGAIAGGRSDSAPADAGPSDSAPYGPRRRESGVALVSFAWMAQGERRARRRGTSHDARCPSR